MGWVGFLGVCLAIGMMLMGVVVGVDYFFLTDPLNEIRLYGFFFGFMIIGGWAVAIGILLLLSRWSMFRWLEKYLFVGGMRE